MGVGSIGLGVAIGCNKPWTEDNLSFGVEVDESLVWMIGFLCIFGLAVQR